MTKKEKLAGPQTLNCEYRELHEHGAKALDLNVVLKSIASTKPDVFLVAADGPNLQKFDICFGKKRRIWCLIWL